MKTIIKQILLWLVVLVVLVTFFVLSACTYDKTIPFTEAFASSCVVNTIEYNAMFGHSFETQKRNVAELMTSRQEVQSFCVANYLPFLDEENSSEIALRVKSYDDTFFEKKAVIAIVFTENFFVSFSVESVTVENESINVGFVFSTGSDDYAQVVTTFIYLLEINQEDVVGCETVIIIKTEK